MKKVENNSNLLSSLHLTVFGFCYQQIDFVRFASPSLNSCQISVARTGTFGMAPPQASTNV